MISHGNLVDEKMVHERITGFLNYKIKSFSCGDSIFAVTKEGLGMMTLFNEMKLIFFLFFSKYLDGVKTVYIHWDL